MNEYIITGEAAMLTFGSTLAAACGKQANIYLSGELGAGKTTLVRGFLRGLGYCQNVKSPTYTLVEPYEIAGQKIFHFDLYRLVDPLELEDIGIRDYFMDEVICLVEWFEQGGKVLPLADLNCYISLEGEGRLVRLVANSERGREILARTDLLNTSVNRNNLKNN